MRPGRMSTRSSSRGSILHSPRIAFTALLLLGLVTGAVAKDVALPPANAPYDSQLGGAYPPPAGTQVVSRDRLDPAFSGGYSICYVNAFQTQPQEADWWKANHPDLLLRKADGALVEDENWPGEILLDTSTAEKRAKLVQIVGAWIDQCAADGFDAIEADNLDTYSRSDDALSIEDNLAFAKTLIERAHAAGLAFGQKNGAELGSRGRAVGFDFAIMESCQIYAECEDYTDIFGANVLEIEYTDTDAEAFETACAARGDQISVIRRDRNLSMPSEATYFYRQC